MVTTRRCHSPSVFSIAQLLSALWRSLLSIKVESIYLFNNFTARISVSTFSKKLKTKLLVITCLAHSFCFSTHTSHRYWMNALHMHHVKKNPIYILWTPFIESNKSTWEFIYSPFWVILVACKVMIPWSTKSSLTNFFEIITMSPSIYSWHRQSYLLIHAQLYWITDIHSHRIWILCKIIPFGATYSDLLWS